MNVSYRHPESSCTSRQPRRMNLVIVYVRKASNDGTDWSAANFAGLKLVCNRHFLVDELADASQRNGYQSRFLSTAVFLLLNTFDYWYSRTGGHHQPYMAPRLQIPSKPAWRGLPTTHDWLLLIFWAQWSLSGGRSSVCFIQRITILRNTNTWFCFWSMRWRRILDCIFLSLSSSITSFRRAFHRTVWVCRTFPMPSWFQPSCRDIRPWLSWWTLWCSGCHG